MDGRWTLHYRGGLWAVEGEPPAETPLSFDAPVVPCDDSAIERARNAYEGVIDQYGCQDAPPSDDVVVAVLTALKAVEG